MIALDATHVAVDVPGQVVELSLDGKLLAAHPVVGMVSALAYVDGRLWAAVAGGVYVWEGPRLVHARSARQVSGIGPDLPDALGVVWEGARLVTGRHGEAACVSGPDDATWCGAGSLVQRRNDERELPGVLRAGGRLGLVLVRAGEPGLYDVDGALIRTLPGPDVAMAGDLLAVRTSTGVVLSGSRTASWKLPALPSPAPMLVPSGSVLVGWAGWVERIEPATGASLERHAASGELEVAGDRLVMARPALDERENALVYDDGGRSWVAAIPGQAGPRLGDVVTLLGEDGAVYGLATSDGARRWRVAATVEPPPRDRRGAYSGDRLHAVRAGSWLIVQAVRGAWFTLDAAGRRGRSGSGDLAGCDTTDEPLIATTDADLWTVVDLRDGSTTAAPPGACPAGRLQDGGVVWTRGEEVGVSDTHGVRWRQRELGHPVAVAAVQDLVLLGGSGLVALDAVSGEPRWTRPGWDGAERFLLVR